MIPGSTRSKKGHPNLEYPVIINCDYENLHFDICRCFSTHVIVLLQGNESFLLLIDFEYF